MLIKTCFLHCLIAMVVEFGVFFLPACSAQTTSRIEQIPRPPAQQTPPVITARKSSTVSVRIKDITDIEGIRVNKLSGFGLVVGLNGTGGDTPDTRQFALNVLENFFQRTGPDVREAIRNDTQFKTDNISVVFVTAELFQNPIKLSIPSRSSFPAKLPTLILTTSNIGPAVVPMRSRRSTCWAVG